MVWLLEVSSAAREDWDRLQAVLRCSLDARAQVLQAGGRKGIFRCTGDCQRWRVVSVAPQAERKRPVDFWTLGEGCWRVKLGRGGLGWEFADVWISGQKLG